MRRWQNSWWRSAHSATCGRQSWGRGTSRSIFRWYGNCR